MATKHLKNVSLIKRKITFFGQMLYAVYMYPFQENNSKLPKEFLCLKMYVKVTN